MTLTAGSICTGYGGFDLGLQAVSGVSLTWVSEIDRHASIVLNQRFPAVPNIGDINNAQPDPVDIITAGFPCQDISNAGHGAGIHGERSGLWWRIRDVISDIRPRYVLLENVSAILANGGPAVIGSLTEIGYNARWITLRASDIGAPHRRERWFCFAWNTEGGGRDESAFTGTGQRGRPTGTVRRPSDFAAYADSYAGRRDARRISGKKEPGRGVVDQSDGPRDSGDASTDSFSGGRDGGPQTQGRGPQRRATTSRDSGKAAPYSERYEQIGQQSEQQGRAPSTRDSGGIDFAQYGPAVERWETILGRTAPTPNIGGRLNPAFVEWMMGLPEGWVTGVDVSHSQKLKMLGNGIVPQQAKAAITMLNKGFLV